MRSLATVMYEKPQYLGDCLFRLVVANCENHALSPSWWENLSKTHQNEITDKYSKSMDMLSIVKNTYLTDNLHNICGWNFENVISNME